MSFLFSVQVFFLHYVLWLNMVKLLLLFKWKNKKVLVSKIEIYWTKTRQLILTVRRVSFKSTLWWETNSNTAFLILEEHCAYTIRTKISKCQMTLKIRKLESYALLPNFFSNLLKIEKKIKRKYIFYEWKEYQHMFYNF